MDQFPFPAASSTIRSVLPRGLWKGRCEVGPGGMSSSTRAQVFSSLFQSVSSADLTAHVDTVCVCGCVCMCVCKLAGEFHTDVLLMLFVAPLCESPTPKTGQKSKRDLGA